MTTTETIRTLVEGHWIKDNGIYKCTACNSLCTVAGWADCIPEKQMYKVFRFCPNCGAKMDEDRDYEHAVEQLEHDMTFEPTYNPEDGSM